MSNPLKQKRLAHSILVEFEVAICLVRGIEQEHLRADDATQVVGVSVIGTAKWIPANIRNVLLGNVGVIDGVTLVIRAGEHPISRERHKPTFFGPVTVENFFAVFGNAWNLPLLLPVIEKEGTFFSTNNEYRVSPGPAQIASDILC